MNILVTGGCGFIGSNYIRLVLNQYPDSVIINIDNLTYAGNLETTKDIENNYPERYKFLQLDLTDKAGLQTLVDSVDFDLVVNFAAESHVDRSIESADNFIQSNIVGTANLLEVLHNKWKNDLGLHKYIQISTDEVYGALEDSTGFFTEETPIAPNSPYSASKASADMLVRSYVKTHNFPAMITRCSNNYGPYQYPEKFLPVMIQSIMEKKIIPVYGQGKNVREWIHVEDHCTAIDTVSRFGKIGEIYNVGSGEELSNIELVEMVLDLMDGPRTLIKYVTDRKGHDFRYAIDSTKLRRIGWEPRHNFRIGLQQTINWYEKNQDWINKVLSKEQ